MTIKKIIIGFIFLLQLIAVGTFAQSIKPVQYVDPYIGTGGHGHVFLGASVPFGAVQLGPLNITEGWDWCSGYHYSDSSIAGFAHTHLSGTGIGDLGDISLMPVTGNPKMNANFFNESGFASLFSHKDEKVVPGYYSVLLPRYNISAEMTTTERVGLHHYEYKDGKTPQVIIDLQQGTGWDKAVKTFLRWENDSTIIGYRYSKGWSDNQRIYFAAIFNKPVKQCILYDGISIFGGRELLSDSGKALLSFEVGTTDVMVKVGISPVSIENAKANINAELPHWNFKEIRDQATAKWNAGLSRILVKTKDVDRLKTFYTALYHTMIAPSIYNDHNGDYLGTDKKIHRAASFTNVTTLSLWDTYRALHPLFTIIQKDRVPDIINSMLAIYQQQGKLPIWHLMGSETNTMPGYSGIQVVADAYLKGFKNIDSNLLWEALKNSAMQDDRGLRFVKKYGYIPADSVVESVALGMEYSISDAAIAQVAKKMKKEEYAYFSRRGKGYQYYIEPSGGFARGRLSKTEWRTPYSPFLSKHRADDFSEGNGWQYSWLVPEDVRGLQKIMGGTKKFTAKLDSLFTVHGDMGEESSSDISGLIGQYAHGNEPSHHIAYLYTYAGQPWKTAQRVRQILDSLYHNDPDGLSGNEDVGQMSAWYILSSIGLYQVNPAGGIFVFGSPVMDEVVLNAHTKKPFYINTINNSSMNKYIQRITLNGKSYAKTYILYKDIMAGGKLQMTMGANPSKTWGIAKDSWPPDEIDYN